MGRYFTKKDMALTKQKCKDGGSVFEQERREADSVRIKVKSDSMTFDSVKLVVAIQIGGHTTRPQNCFLYDTQRERERRDSDNGASGGAVPIRIA